jgi:hypothetical protein
MATVLVTCSVIVVVAIGTVLIAEGAATVEGSDDIVNVRHSRGSSSIVLMNSLQAARTRMNLLCILHGPTNTSLGRSMKLCTRIALVV